MKNLISVLTVIAILIVVSSNLAISTEKKFELTDSQKRFAKSISDEVPYSKAEWINSYQLNATLKPHWSGLFPKDKAKNQANLISAEGFLYTGENICVKIIDPELGEIAYECSGNQSES